MTVCPAVVAPALVHVPVNPEPMLTPMVPVAGTLTFEGNTTLTVDDEESAPEE